MVVMMMGSYPKVNEKTRFTEIDGQTKFGALVAITLRVAKPPWVSRSMFGVLRDSARFGALELDGAWRGCGVRRRRRDEEVAMCGEELFGLFL